MSTAVVPTLAEIRERRADHERELSERSFYAIAELARRWSVSETTVRDIPRDELPYLEFGRGLHKKRRRYRPADVEAYEAAHLHAEERAP